MEPNGVPSPLLNRRKLKEGYKFPFLYHGMYVAIENSLICKKQ